MEMLPRRRRLAAQQKQLYLFGQSFEGCHHHEFLTKVFFVRSIQGPTFTIFWGKGVGNFNQQRQLSRHSRGSRPFLSKFWRAPPARQGCFCQICHRSGRKEIWKRGRQKSKKTAERNARKGPKETLEITKRSQKREIIGKPVEKKSEKRLKEVGKKIARQRFTTTSPLPFELDGSTKGFPFRSPFRTF